MANPNVQAMLATARGQGGQNFPGRGAQTQLDAVSPLFTQWAQQAGITGSEGWAQVYAPAVGLPRTFDTYRAGQFGPFEPLYPAPIDVGEPPSGRPRPRRWVYPVGWNIFIGPPGTEGVKLASFQQLISLAEPQSVLRSCIEIGKGDLASLDVDVIPTVDAQRDMQGNPKKRTDFESRRSEVLEFLMNPDPDQYDGFGEWLNAMLEDRFVLDAVAIHLQRAGGKGNGPLGSDLGALALLDGSTIKPLLNEWGSRPRTPEPGYQQILWGMPRVDLMDMINLGPEATLDDLKDLNPILNELSETVDQWSGDQLLYFKANARTRSPYGFSPVEMCLLPASIMQARQDWQWQFFAAGSLPSVFMDPGESIANAQEAKDIQDSINQMGGDIASMHQVIVTPPGAKIVEQKPVDLTSQFDEWVTALIVMPFGYSISDLGITPKVTSMQSPQASRSAAKTASDRSTRRAVIPTAKKLKEKIFDRIIQKQLGQKDMQWSWGIEEQGESRGDLVDQTVELVGKGLMTIDEGRIVLDMDPLGLEETSIPGIVTATGYMPLSAAVAISNAQAEQAQNPPPMLAPGTPGQSGGGQRALPPGKPKPPGSKPGPPRPGGPKPPTGGKPGGTPTSTAGKPKPGSSASPAQAGSSTANAKPKPTRQSGSGGSSQTNAKPTKTPAKTSKAAEVELEQLFRFLKRGGSLVRFVPKSLSPVAMSKGRGDTPYAVVSSITKAQTAVEHKRDAVAAATVALTAKLSRHVGRFTDGKTTKATFMDKAQTALAGAYAGVMAAGADYAYNTAPDSVSLAKLDDFSNPARGRAILQGVFLSGFADDAMGGLSDAQIDARAGLYGATLAAAYSEGAVTQASNGDGSDATDPGSGDGTDQVAITWNLGDTAEPCAMCVERDGRSYAPADLPGYPGDGGFGDLCEGGSRCGCWLEFLYGDEALAATQESLGRQISLGEVPAADLSGGFAADVTESVIADLDKDFSLSSPLSTSFVPFDLAAGVRRIDPDPFESKRKIHPVDALHGYIDVTSTDVTKGSAVDALADTAIRFAGLAVRAADTGRVLMLQRAISDEDYR